MLRLFAYSAAAFAISGCTTAQVSTADGPPNEDPWESFNRPAYAFNEGLDKAILQPASQAYDYVVPDVAQTGVGNFLSNLGAPVVFVNDVLQANPERAANTAYRFILNTTVGIGGLLDAGTYFGIEKHNEDFGQTLAVWGLDSGPYLVVPFFGPSNPRDLTGTIVDGFFNPINYAEFEGDDAFRITTGVVGVLNARAGAQEAIEGLREQPEPYTALRRFYESNRATQIRNGQNDPASYEELPDFEDYE